MKQTPLRPSLLGLAALVLLAGAVVCFLPPSPPPAAASEEGAKSPRGATESMPVAEPVPLPTPMAEPEASETLIDPPRVWSNEEALGHITALAQVGQFAAAVQFAGEGTPDQRPAWLAAAFALWSAAQPQAAAAAALTLGDPALREAAWRGVAAAWAQKAPADLAEYAVALPPGDLRRYALNEAIRKWAALDAQAAAGWLNQLALGPERDGLIPAIALLPSLATDPPELALCWAETITEPALRSRTVGRIVREWASVDPVAAAGYARNTPMLLPAEREDTLVGERFTPHP